MKVRTVGFTLADGILIKALNTKYGLISRDVPVERIESICQVPIMKSFPVVHQLIYAGQIKHPTSHCCEP